MKRLLVLLLLPLSALAVTRTVTINAPSQVTAGQAFTVPTSASTDAGGGEQIGFYHAEYSTNGGSSWSGFCYDVNVGGSATRNASITAGAAGSTVVVRVRIAFRGGAAGDVDYNGGAINWGGSWDGWQTPPTKYSYISVVAPPNQPPTINWIQNPASAYINQWFAIQSRGDDPNGNLSQVNVWKEWVPFAFNGGGNGYQNYSDANSTYSSSQGSITFQTQAWDSAGANSAVIFHTVTINNRAPSGTFTINGAASNATVNFGQTVSIASTVSDPDGNLSVHSFWWDQGSGLYWTHPYLNWSYPTNRDGWLNLNLGANGYDASGTASTRGFDFRAIRAGTFVFHNAVADPYAWVGVGTSVMNVVVNKTTPSGTFPAKSFSGSRTLTAGDLNATFANPYSGAVAAPTGSVSYSVVSASGAGASPTSGAVGVGTTLTPGNYTIRASYGGDANYNATTVDAAFTVGNIAPMISMSASPTTITFGQTANLTSVATDTDGNLSFHGILVLNQSGSDWNRSASTDHSTGWGNHPTTNDFIAISYSSGVTSGASSTRTATHRPSFAGTITYHNNTHDSIVWASSDAGNWAACVGYAYVTVNKATPSGTFADRSFSPAGATYTVQAADLNASFANPYSGSVAAPTGGITYSIVGPGTGVTAGTNLSAGTTYTIRASYSGDGNYNATTKDTVWTFAKANQTITFNNPGTQTYGTPLTLGATASSGLAVSYAVTSGPATVSGSTVTFTGAGTVTITASQGGNANYNAASNVAQAFSVNAWPTTFALTQTSFTYNGSAQGPSVVPTPGGATFSTGGTMSATNAGGYTATATANGNFTGSNAGLTWSIAMANQSITFNNPGTQTYGTPLTLGATASSGLGVSYAVSAGPATVSGNTVTFTGAGTVTVTASQAGNANYNAASNVAQTFTVNPQPTTFALNQTSFTYNGAAQGPGVVATPGGATFSTGGTLSATNVGSYTATASANGNYTGSNASLGWTIAASGQTITFNNPGTQTYGTPLTLGATASSGLAVSYAITSGPATVSGNTVTFTGAGSVTVRASQGGNANYGAAPNVDQTFTVNPAGQTISFSNPGTQTYGTPLTLGATASSGLAVSYAVSAGPATVSGNTVTFTGAGTVTITASQAGNANYSAASNVAQTFTVNPQPTTFALNQTSFTYNGAAQGPSVVPTPGGATFSTGGTMSATNAGGYTATATANGNFTGSNAGLTWSIAMANQSITFNNPGTQTYGTPLTLGATASSGLAVSYVVTSGPATVSGNTVTFTGAGTVTVTASQGGNGNYNAAGNVAQTFAVNKANQTITFNNPGTQTYGTPLTLGATASSGLSVSYAVTSGPATVSGSTVTFTGAGTVTITATQAGDANYNAAAATPQTFTVNPSGQTITFGNPGTQTYGTPLTLGATASSGLTVSYAVTSGPATVSGSTVTFTGIGAVTVTASQTGNTNYSVATPVAQAFTVNPSAATFSFGNLSHTYDGTAKTATVTPTPAGATYDASDLTKGPGVGTYTVTVTANGNYTGSGSSTLTIGKATPSATFSGRSLNAAGIGYAVLAGDLNALFSGPAGAAAPTGAVVYTIAPGSAAGASGSAVAAGTSLGGGLVYTLRASYPGDGNYNAFTADAVWTINLDPNADNDGDGMPNGWEQSNGLNPLSAPDAMFDPDNDGFTNIAEYNLGHSPQGYDQGTSNLGNSIPGGWPNGGINAQLAVGATAGELNVDKSGAATYSVPIWTTPGTAGMQPQVSLNYSSQGGAGIAGFGWSLSGVSAITRGPTTMAVDGYVDGVDFDGNDQYYLDGQRLILVGGTHGQPGAEYRTELETFTRVVAYGTRGNGPARFKAQTKAGLVIWFGHADSDSTNDGSTFDAYAHTEPFSWQVSRILDTKGNYMNFSYEEIVNSAEGSHRLTQIDYTGNGGVSPYASLRFEYEDRPDFVRGYSAGSPVSSLKRLKAIKSYYGPTVARTYTLDYTQREYTGRSLLVSLTEAGSDGKAYPALTFDYGMPAYGWDQAAANFNYEPAYPLGDNQSASTYPTGTGFVDLNGDGRVDFIARRDSNSGPVAQTFSLNTGTGWNTDPSGYGFNLPHPLAYSDRADDTGGRFVDFDNDGLVDFVVYKVDANGNYQARSSWKNTGTGWTEVYGDYQLPAPAARDSSGSDYSKRGGRFADVNGDGRSDYIAYLTTSPGVNAGKTKLAVYLNNGSGWNQTADFGYQTLPGGSPPDMADYQARLVDISGDGLPDLVAAYKDGSTVNHYVALNTGSGWQGTGSNWVLPTWIAESGQPRIGAEFVDLNSDGLPDLIWSRESPVVEWGYALNTGEGWDSHVGTNEAFRSPVELGRQGMSSGGATFTDFNADGVPDLLMARYLSSTSSKSVHLGSSAGWQATSDSGWNLPEHLLVQSFTNVGADFVDLDGDGVSDFVWKRWAPWGAVEKGLARNLANPLADRLSKVTNGLGVAASLTYKALLDATVYTQGSGGPAGSVNLSGPMYVVANVTHDDGVGGQYPLNYKYAGLRADRLRGSLGFEQMTVTDGRTAIRSETTFAQQFPFTGMPVTAKTISGSVTLKDTVVVYQEKLLNSNQTHFVFAQDSDEVSKDLNGVDLGSVSTSIPAPASDIDDYGNIKKLVVDSSGFVKTTDSVFTNDTGNWFLGRLTSSTVTSSAPSGYGSPITRNSLFTYDGGTGLLLTEAVQPGDAVLGLTTIYGYDQFGNKTSVQVSGSGLSVDGNGNYSVSGGVSRTTTTQYDGTGRFPSWTKNALNHQETYSGYNQVLGVVTQLTGANGLVTNWAYDGFGRKTQETRADGTVANINYRWVAGAPGQAQYYGGAPTAKYHVETESTGTPPSLTFHDAFGRAFLSLGVNGDGKIVYSTTQYDSMGRTVAASVPYFASSTAYWKRTTAFDLLNRPVTVLTPDEENGDQTISYSYSGLQGTATDPKGRVSRTVRNPAGWTLTNVRNETAGSGAADYSSVSYGYDALGNLTSTVAAGVTTSLGYDLRGRKTAMTDADMGAWQYRYNVFGELIWQKDAKGQVVTMAYDNLGRLISRTEPEGATSWTYDTSPTKGTGKLHTVSAPGGYAETYLYDSLGRPSSLSRTIDGTAYVTQTTYDSVGRPLRTIYPGSVWGTVSTRHVYNNYGYLKEIRHWIASDDGLPNSSLQGKVYWMADSYAVTGQVNGEVYGNGLANDRVYSAVTGRLIRATIDRGNVVTAPFFVQDLNYGYDAVGNVRSRIETTSGFARDERFYNGDPNDGYDGLDRLKVHRVVGGATVTVSYDQKGNITNKSDVGAYTYSGYGPHAVSTAGANNYTYDAVGNMLTGGFRTLEWTSFNQLRQVTQGSLSSEFSFGAGHERVMQVRKNNGNVTDRTIYVGGLYEKVITGTVTEHKHYIMGPTGRIAVYTERSDLTKDTRWFHTDGLGSITVISDENGRVLKRHTYDAWGKQSTAYTNTGSGITNTAPSTRGFTDHEMLSDFGLIHMNGRVYDPVLARFLSADPNVDGASDAQGYNRYSYVGNNPMNATDPSGYFSLKEVLPAIIAIVVTVVAIVTQQYWALNYTGSWLGALNAGLHTLSSVIVGGAAGGFAGGFSGSLLNGGSIGDAFKAGVIGAAVGAATAWASQAIGGFFGADNGTFSQWGERTLAHATVGGLASEAQGGSFRHGFYSSAASAGLMHIKAVDGFLGGDKGGAWIAARTTAAAVIGGTATALGGGKFANGAVTSAFQQLFNNESTRKQRNTVVTESYYAQPNDIGKLIRDFIEMMPPTSALDILIGFGIGGVSGWIDDAYLIQLQEPLLVETRKPSFWDRINSGHFREDVKKIRPATSDWWSNSEKYMQLLQDRNLRASDIESIVRVRTTMTLPINAQDLQMNKPLPGGWGNLGR